jgi:hypothetical protein
MTLHQLTASVLCKFLQFRMSRMLIERWQHVSVCFICCQVWKCNVSESVAGSVHIILGAFMNWRETAVGFVISVRPSACVSWFVTERVFVKLYIGNFMKIR